MGDLITYLETPQKVFDRLEEFNKCVVISIYALDRLIECMS